MKETREKEKYIKKGTDTANIPLPNHPASVKELLLKEGRTFVSIETPILRSAIGVILLVGRKAFKILEECFEGKIPKEPFRISYGRIKEKDGSVIDEVLIADISAIISPARPKVIFTPKEDPKRSIPLPSTITASTAENSKPGAKHGINPEDTPKDETETDLYIFEISTHGSVRIIQRIVKLLTSLGAEYKKFAYLQDIVYRIDNPIESVAYNLLRACRSGLALKFLLYQSRFGLAKAYRENDIKSLRASLNEENIKKVHYILKGIKLVIAGPPNAGKSSLFNRLCRQEHSIVEDWPGTTRDYIWQPYHIDELLFEFIDTPGIGASEDPLYEKAKSKVGKILSSADIIIALLDPTAPAASIEFLDYLTSENIKAPIICAINKIDLLRYIPAGQSHPTKDSVKHKTENADPPYIYKRRIAKLKKKLVELKKNSTLKISKTLQISAKEGINTDTLIDKVKEALSLKDFNYRSPIAFTPYIQRLVKEKISHIEEKEKPPCAKRPINQ